MHPDTGSGPIDEGIFRQGLRTFLLPLLLPPLVVIGGLAFLLSKSPPSNVAAQYSPSPPANVTAQYLPSPPANVTSDYSTIISDSFKALEASRPAPIPPSTTGIR